jgi:S-adenosylmethionine hydrolase
MGESTFRREISTMKTKADPIVALLTDFGTKDPYVAALKGALLSVNPKARLVDVTHEVEAQDVSGACTLLQNVHSYFPQGTIFVVVVDPGVGSDRSILVVLAKGQCFLAPDNGVLSFLDESDILEIRRVTDTKYFRHPISNTFHGRDIFAPVAGHVSKGLALSKLGPRIKRFLRLHQTEKLIETERTVIGEIIHVDKFGNLVTNLPARVLEKGRPPRIEVGGKAIRRMVKSYAEAMPKELVAIIGSSGTLEISVKEESAADITGLTPGNPVVVKF